MCLLGAASRSLGRVLTLELYAPIVKQIDVAPLLTNAYR